MLSIIPLDIFNTNFSEFTILNFVVFFFELAGLLPAYDLRNMSMKMRHILQKISAKVKGYRRLSQSSRLIPGATLLIVFQLTSINRRGIFYLNI